MLLPGNAAEQAYLKHHDSAYQLWRQTWLKTFQELNTDARLRADDFVRQDIVNALFFCDEAVGLSLHSYFNLNLAAVRDHTYLSIYPERILEKLREGTTVLSMEYLTLDPKWRKPLIDVPIAELIAGLAAKIVAQTGLKSIAVTRNEKKVNEILYGYGGTCLASGLKKHNVDVDLVSYDPKTLDFTRNAEMAGWIEYFWERRVDLVHLPQTPRRQAA